MALKNYKPTSPGRRGLVLVDRSDLWKGKPEKTLTEGLRAKGGRNNAGRITARRRGGGHKRRYRMIDFKRQKFDIPAKVERLEYDPNRTAFIALIRYEDGELSYILAPQRLNVGDSVVAGERAGTLDESLRVMATLYRERAAAGLGRLMSVLGGALTVLVFIFIALSILGTFQDVQKSTTDVMDMIEQESPIRRGR